MAVLMANASEVSSVENVQYLYNKNVELESKRRKSAQARIPTDPNVWQQMRENFETIILVDHAFAEQHEIELALWQMHYRQIEEIRANFNAAMAVVGSPPRNGGKTGSARPDRVARIRSQMKTFLSETTGFYHELMLKIKSKYGLPLGYFSDGTEIEAFLSKEGNISDELKKGLISCHRCLIYLGDLARYKGIYGEEESKLRDFAAASGYYMQASSFWPSSGNPHHQLAILASYSGDEFLAVYRYFRSLAVENPFSMARDNLIIAFEKNRLNFSQLIGGTKTPAAKSVPMRMNGKGRPRAEARFSGKDHKIVDKERAASTTSTIKTFSIKFVRLHGILFSRTSLETFTDVLSMAKNDFMDLLSSQDVRSFGCDAAESELFIVRLVAIIFFSVHNANAGRDSEDQLRAVLLEYAYSAAFEFMGIITERCLKLQDPLSSFLFPGLLVFAEWLACRPREFEEENNRALFWNNYVCILNKVVSSGVVVEATKNISLREDFELRGFVPLEAAQQNLDFLRKPCIGVEEKRVRGQKLVVAARALSGFVRVGEQFFYFDHKLNKFVIGEKKPPDIPAENRMDFVDDEEEEIVFKPFAVDKIADAVTCALTPSNSMKLNNEVPLDNAVAPPIQLNSVTNGFTNLSMMENVNMSYAYALNGLSRTPASLLPVGGKRSPVSRPVRHAGPPPGFSPCVNVKKDDDICMVVDDYSWLDGYKVPSFKLTPPEFNNPSYDESTTVGFPFPGKQFSGPKGWQDYHFSQQQQKQFQGQSLWNAQFLV